MSDNQFSVLQLPGTDLEVTAYRVTGSDLCLVVNHATAPHCICRIVIKDACAIGHVPAFTCRTVQVRLDAASSCEETSDD